MNNFSTKSKKNHLFLYLRDGINYTVILFKLIK